MKWLAAILSVFTILSLFSAIKQNATIDVSSTSILKVPESITPIKSQPDLNAEKKWLAYINEPKKLEEKAPEIKEEAKKSIFPTLTIDNVAYQLLGIFKQNQRPFILLKGSATELVKLQEGEELSSGVLLQKITPDAVIIAKGDETIKFKLFERSDNG
ncbi:hypothetical protein [Pseudoalteromonas tunicata]|uniref:hypothetical protein n=1 Tax=Pseudoalteromonas tunicata TaxID=314281 RepID=UPI00273DD511|nr:hypothetical protein [Pseudoalteromonas tunicata]MDP4985450.1 general secretion pathway protein GspB [Pseudoalteromonas tunicata]MDP5213574.1 hypothetical protein [Pseudoalteromonas tunicata]